MTIEEKANKIEEFCSETGCIGRECPLYSLPEMDCYDVDEPDHILKHYEILFGEDPVEDDPVNHPAHYTSGGIECIDAIAASMTNAEYEGFLKGQVIKYVWRYRLKEKPLQDLEKARFYLERLIQNTKVEEDAAV